MMLKQCELLWHTDLEARPANHTFLSVARQLVRRDSMASHVTGVAQEVQDISFIASSMISCDGHSAEHKFQL